MTNKQIANNLQLIYDRILKDLNPMKFKFDNFVTSSKEKNGHLCGTVCCVAGWFPEKFPNSGLGYMVIEDGVELSLKDSTDYTINEIKEHLSKITGLEEDWVSYLFFGDNDIHDYIDIKSPLLESNSSLSEVRKAWLKSIEYFKNKEEKVFKYSLT